ncbi:hypothetical protein ID866_3528, partial [Astraeus odoratus]
IGLRHALDADHIRYCDYIHVCFYSLGVTRSAIDNATRTLVSHGQLPVTCGLFFSLGHSTIVVVVNLAIVISTSVYNKLNGFSNIASVIGTAVSGSFLFVVGAANTIILWGIIRRRRLERRRDVEDTVTSDQPSQNMLMMRLLGPLINFVDRPWKMYPVGVLFGLGFDTASSIALLSLSALAQQTEDGSRIQPSSVIVLPLLFTTGMTLVDSLDSVLMLYSYAGFAEQSWKIFEQTQPVNEDRPTENDHEPSVLSMVNPPDVATQTGEKSAAIEHPSHQVNPSPSDTEGPLDSAHTAGQCEDDRVARVKRHTMSNLSIILTTMSILLAFSIALIEIMGLIGQECGSCQAAASDPDGGGLAGNWWRAWQQANDNSGYIGAAIVGVFVLLVAGWYGGKWVIRRRNRADLRRQEQDK